MNNVDQQFGQIINKVLREGVQTKGRTETNRIRLLEGVTLSYDCSDGKMSAFSLRKNSPNLAIAETLAFLMGASTVSELEQAHPALKLWNAWASDDGNLGGVYGDAFHEQYFKVIKGLRDNPSSTHHRMTTLLPDKFPIAGNTYEENVKQGLFSLMPCLHSYHFLSDGSSLWVHATQASADLPVGVFPHNVYQVQFMLLLTAYLTGLKPAVAKHHIHDAHIYTNQLDEVKEMLSRTSLHRTIKLSFDDLFTLSELRNQQFQDIPELVTTSKFITHPPIIMKVDS